MNLIDQLGGYDFVRGFCERARKYGFVLNEIHDALLEYRRKNNIFEVIEYSIRPKRNGELSVFMCFKGDDEDNFCIAGLQVRHATDEEIKVGYRL